MRLVDHQQAGGGSELGQQLLAKVHGIEALGAHEEYIGLTALDLPVDGVPFLGVGRVDGPRPDTGPRRRLDLVAHQREQGRDDHRRAGTTSAQQSGGDEVHRRLAPARALHHQGATALLHQGRHRLPLVLPQPGRTAGGTDELSEDGIGFGAELQIVHVSMQPDATDNQPPHSAQQALTDRRRSAPSIVDLVVQVTPCVAQ